MLYWFRDFCSLTKKYYGTTSDPYDQYSYNLLNRLTTFTPDSGSAVTYTYNPDGIRVSKTSGSLTSDYLIDPYNPTGYSQVFKEKPSAGDETVYIIGNDVLGQATGTSTPVYMLYDGHGSVRQLADNAGSLVSGQSFNYDAYGNLLGSVTPQTNLLYTGERWDIDIESLYLRSRDYRPDIGRFMTQDTYSGNNSDPISLHKYLYAHANPINGIDPSGQFGDFSLTGMVQSMAIQSIAMNVLSPFIKPVESIFTQGLIKGLLPLDIFEQLKNTRISAVMFGGSISGVAAKGLAVGFGGGLEVLISPTTGKVGLYGYSEWIIGATRANSGAMGVAKAGVVLNAPNLGAYEGNFRSITFPFRAIPKRMRQEIIKRFTLTPWEAMNLPKVSDLQAKVQSFYNKAKILPKMIDGSTQCTIFYTPGSYGPFGISISKLYLPGNTGLVAFGMQYYKLLLGNPNDKLY